MQPFLSPQHNNIKHDLFTKQRSPSFRTKRIPSVQDQHLGSSNHLKVIKPDSPSKLSEEIKRRRSQYA